MCSISTYCKCLIHFNLTIHFVVGANYCSRPAIYLWDSKVLRKLSLLKELVFHKLLCNTNNPKACNECTLHEIAMYVKSQSKHIAHHKTKRWKMCFYMAVESNYLSLHKMRTEEVSMSSDTVSNPTDIFM